MLSKESKMRVLENFYALDYVLFGKPVKKMSTCCQAVTEEYLSVKGALLSVFIEMLKTIDHSPAKLTEELSLKNLTKSARSSAILAREKAESIVTTEKAKIDIKKSLREEIQRDSKLDASVMVEQKIREKAFSLAIDNLLVARAINECKNYNNLNDWAGKIIEDSYKILRNALVESASLIIENAD